ncbi:ABC transporter ATP-binding protein [Bifidobacterium breve]|uniref:ABC transporter ATP-binding protein n=2 Tax=Bifidobacterium breve TaxID=1685 RepID=UPI0006C8150C|nr:ABC transporter ATP-binding protein [Bifidobacterium breve]AZI16307.1 ABC transporter ATP-binding protein [Bifidobacterium breve]MDX5146512.1 ABC transporter ATP-binding protein [Bifidobacterium breve]GDZ15537.1 hypothetical protein MCC01954_20040 [Bifidobacteriaceae bacterium MCC01954]
MWQRPLNPGTGNIMTQISAPPMIRLMDVSKGYGGKQVLHGIDMSIDRGEFVVLVGPSGGGKTTLLQLLNKMLTVDDGEIYIDGRPISRMPGTELRRSIGYVIQGGGLFPHMTVERNIGIMMELAGRPKSEVRERVAAMLDMVELERSLLDSYPSQLSGGQQQRVGVARAFATNPDIILMDEPFSALDPITRADLQGQLVDLHHRYGKTIVFVTHDMDEAVKCADRICVIQHGAVLQFDTPAEILANPASDFVASFVGRAESVSRAIASIAGRGAGAGGRRKELTR